MNVREYLGRTQVGHVFVHFSCDQLVGVGTEALAQNSKKLRIGGDIEPGEVALVARCVEKIGKGFGEDMQFRIFLRMRPFIGMPDGATSHASERSAWSGRDEILLLLSAFGMGDLCDFCQDAVFLHLEDFGEGSIGD